MLKTTEQERQQVLNYMADRVPDEKVELIQKVYSEQIHSVIHEIWDVHTNLARWWVITNPINLYSQNQFPNMDLALTFHVGLSLRIPTSERQSLPERNIEPLFACWRTFEEAREALNHAAEVEDFQAIGMRCRESLITLIHLIQQLIQIPTSKCIPKASDFRAWSGIIAETVLAGSSHRNRRSLLKSSADIAWEFTNWLTHARRAHFYDADAALGVTELTLSLFTTTLIRHLRGVPDCCPSCGSQRLSPERGFNTSDPDTIFERPVCQKCGWTGKPVMVSPTETETDQAHPEGECVTMNPPLRQLRNDEK